MTRPTDPSAGRDVVATLALASVSVAVVLGFARVFPGWGFLGDLLTLVIVGHGLSFVLRRLHTPGWLALPLTFLVLGHLVLWQSYDATFSVLLPTSETWSVARLELELVRDQFATTTAPVVHGAGWALLAGIGVALTVWLADTFAFRADARAEALVPGGVLFVFIGALGDERSRVALAGLLVATACLAVVALRSFHAPPRRAEIRSSRSRPELVAPVAIGTAVAVALLAGVVGPRLPGASAEPLYDARGRSAGVTEVSSPLVDIRSRLVNQSDDELFVVDSTEESYWRSTTLPEFDGTTFRLPTRSLQRIDGAFGNERPGGAVIRQDIEIAALRGQLLPVAADPIEASGPGLRWNPDTSTLVQVEGEFTAGDFYTVVSSSPRLAPSQLRGTSAVEPPDPVHLALPDDFPSSVTELAAGVTAGAPTDYDAALALQRFFRTEFEYSLEVPSGHGSSVIEVFLRQRIGYCEQFAATFAAMARTLGMPSRVAVGYTPGTQDASGRYSVRGRNAHAWPEIWFDDVGWVPFEPTPGRGAPGAEQHTGVAPEQDTTPPAAGDDDAEFVPAVPDQTVPPLPPAEPEVDDLAELFADPTAGQGGGGDGGATDDPGPPVALLAALALVLLLAVPTTGRRLHARHRARKPAPERVRDAWRRATRAAIAAGVPATPAMTTAEWAAATGATLPPAARPMRSLAGVVDAVTFGPVDAVDLERSGQYGESLVRDCQTWARQVDSIASDRLGLARRISRYLAFWR
ncbi:MAG: DUF3488 and transglutaminase-like domain-containing protein [Ilumatobacteraceae bacterium]